MKNYVYGWTIKDRGFVEMAEDEYTEHQINMGNFIKSMSAVIADARCGWDGVRYEVVRHRETDSTTEYMVLYCDGGERWIPISGNSKGCNFEVLGQNLW